MPCLSIATSPDSDIQNKIKLFKSKLTIKHKKGWNNFCRNVKLPNSIVLDIDKVDDLQKAYRTALKLNKGTSPESKLLFRTVAGGKKDALNIEEKYSQSFSIPPGAEAHVIARMTGKTFQKIERLDKNKNIVRVGCNVQVGELDKTLYEKFGLSLPTSSLIPFVTFVGLIANAGHGTGKDQPAVAGLVRAMTICRPDGKIERIDANDPEFEVIRAGHLGLFGTVLDVDIECIPAKKLRCVTEARSINQLKQEIADGLFHKDDYTSIMYIPTYQQNERDQKNVVVVRWQPVDINEPDVNCKPKLDHFGQELSINLCNLFSVPGFLANHPNLIPIYMRTIMSRIEVGNTDTYSVGPWHDIAHYQTAYPWDLDDGDYLFRTKGKDCKEIVTALDHVVGKLEEYAKRDLYPVIDAIYMRFFKGLNGGLSTSAHSNDEHVCGFDIVSCAAVPGYAAFKNEMNDFFFNTLKALPHWGKSVPLNLNYAERYGEAFTAFKETLKNWYQKCGLTLNESPLINNFFSHILQLPVVPALSLAEQQDEKVALAQPAIPAHKLAQKILDHIQECYAGNEEVCMLKESLQEVVDEQKPVLFHFTQKNQRLSFLNNINDAAPEAMNDMNFEDDELDEDEDDGERVTIHL